MARIVIEFCNRARRSRSEYELIQHWTIWLLCCRRSPLPVQWLLRTQAGYLRLPEKGNTKACQQSKRTHEQKIRCLGSLPHKRPPLHIQVVVCLRSGLGSGAILLSVPTPSKPNPALSWHLVHVLPGGGLDQTSSRVPQTTGVPHSRGARVGEGQRK